MGDDLTVREAISQGVVSDVLIGTDFGDAWTARLAIAIALGGTLLSLKSTRRNSLWTTGAGILLSAAMVGTLAWAGHAAGTAGSQGNVHIAADVLHLIAAAAWAGALLPLAMLLHAARSGAVPASLIVAREAVLRFSTLGVMSVGVLVASGGVNTWMLTGSLPALVSTDYGRLLIAKFALFLVMLGTAAINRNYLTPRIVSDEGNASRAAAVLQIERNCVLEASVAACIIVIVAVLGTMAPGLTD
jgi:putative copper resistance protein D